MGGNGGCGPRPGAERTGRVASASLPMLPRSSVGVRSVSGIRRRSAVTGNRSMLHLVDQASGADQADRARLADAMRGVVAVVPCFGLTGWAGERMVGPWTWCNGQHSSAGFVFGSPDGDGPSVVVVSSAEASPFVMVGELRAADASVRTGEAMFPDDLERFAAQVATSDKILLPVEDQLVTFRIWQEGCSWWAAARHAGTSLAVGSLGVELSRIRLERITDIEPFLTGRASYDLNRRVREADEG